MSANEIPLGADAISTVGIAGTRADGSSIAYVNSAVCDVCGKWATELRVASVNTKTTDDLFDVRVSRTLRVVAYACHEHSVAVENSLCDEYGWSSNRLVTDDLAAQVDRLALARRSLRLESK